PTPPNYTLPLHDALPIFDPAGRGVQPELERVEVQPGAVEGEHHDLAVQDEASRQGPHGGHHVGEVPVERELLAAGEVDAALVARSEEHTSELQSRGHLVC